MRTLFPLLCMLLLPVSASAAASLAVRDLDPVTIQPAPEHEPVVLVSDGEPKAAIFFAGSGGKTFNSLSKELPAAIEATTGAKLEVVKEMPAADQPAIIVGDCAAARAAGIDVDAIPVEGYVVKTAPNRVFIVGTWGIADFLERLVGVRWYWPLSRHGRTVEKARTLKIEPLHYTDAPTYRMRVGWPPQYPNGLNLWNVYAFLRGGNSWHSVIRVHQPMGWSRLYFEERPEIFALRADGTRNTHMYCYANPATLETFLENIELYKSLPADKRGDRKWVRQQQGLGSKISFIAGNTISVSPPDLGVDCNCERCQAMLEPDHESQYGTASRLMADFTRRLAEKVEKRWPDMKVLFLPYVNYTIAPEGVEFPDNVEVQLCGMPGVAMYKQPGLRKKFQDNIDRWAELTGGMVQTWDYSCWPTDRTKAPFQYPHVLKEYYLHNRGKLIGTFINGGIPDEWTTQHITMYCWMKLMWDPEIDVDAVMDEFCRRMFGPAEQPMRELLRLQTDRWEQVEWPVDAISPKALYEMTYSAEVMEKMQALLTEAQAKAEQEGDAAVRERIAFYAAPFPAFYAEAEAQRSGKGLQNVVARKVADNPVIDGKLDDRWWKAPEPVSLRLRGDEPRPAGYKTEVRAVWTLDGVTFGIKMYEPNPEALQMDLTLPDSAEMWPVNDNVEIFLDVTGRKEGAFYQFMINPAGAVYDSKQRDARWTAEGMKHAIQIGEDFWTLEIYLPLTAFPDAIQPGTGKAWPCQITRHRISDGRKDRKDDSKAEYSRLNNKLGGFSRNVADFGLLKFVE